MSTDSQHENLERSHVGDGSTDRGFGLVFAVVFLIIGLWPLINGATPRILWLIVAAVFAVLAFFFAHVLAPLNQLWMRFGLLLGRIISPIMLAIVFYIIVTPTGFIMRLLRRDLLQLKRDANVDSYWIRRDPAGPDPESMKNQF